MDIFEAIKNGDTATVQEYIKNNDVNTKYGFSKDSLLHKAVDENQVEIAKLLLEANADIDIKNVGDITPLHRAVVKNQLDMVKFLLENNADKGIQNLSGYTPLHIAVLNGNVEAFRILIRAGANLEIRDNKGRTPLDMEANSMAKEILSNIQQNTNKNASEAVQKNRNKSDVSSIANDNSSDAGHSQTSKDINDFSDSIVQEKPHNRSNADDWSIAGNSRAKGGPGWKALKTVLDMHDAEDKYKSLPLSQQQQLLAEAIKFEKLNSIEGHDKTETQTCISNMYKILDTQQYSEENTTKKNTPTEQNNTKSTDLNKFTEPSNTSTQQQATATKSRASQKTEKSKDKKNRKGGFFSFFGNRF